MRRVLESFVTGALAGLAMPGCGGGTASSPSDAKVSAAISASASELEPGVADPVPTFLGVPDQLRMMPQLAPMFDAFQVPNPMVIDDDAQAQGLIDLLHSVMITMSGGTLTITNRATGAVIYSAPVADLASGMFQPGSLPGGAPHAALLRLPRVARYEQPQGHRHLRLAHQEHGNDARPGRRAAPGHRRRDRAVASARVGAALSLHPG